MLLTSPSRVCSELVNQCLVSADLISAGARGARAPSEAVAAMAAPLVYGGRSPAVTAFVHRQLHAQLALQSHEVAMAFAKVCAAPRLLVHEQMSVIRDRTLKRVCHTGVIQAFSKDSLQAAGTFCA